MYFPIEFLGLPVFVTTSDESKNRLKVKGFLQTILKSLPLSIMKLYIIFKSGQTVGFYSVFSLAKTYILFSKGVGESVPFLFRKL